MAQDITREDYDAIIGGPGSRRFRAWKKPGSPGLRTRDEYKAIIDRDFPLPLVNANTSAAVDVCREALVKIEELTRNAADCYNAVYDLAVDILAIATAALEPQKAAV
jgi:hypothetical protein